MKFGEIFSRFRAWKAKKKAGNYNLNSPNQRAIEACHLKINDNFRTNEDLNIALQNIDKLIGLDGPKNKLLLRKADLLLRKEKYKQARQLLNKLKEDKRNLKLSQKAEKLLSYSHHLQQQTKIKKNKSLNERLQSIAEKYDHPLKNLPAAHDSSFDHNNLSSVRKEAQRARTDELPLLSYELIEEALKAGHESPWLLLGKAISLDMIGRQNEALKILAELQKTNKGEKITQSINTAIKNSQKNTKNYRQTKLNIYLANHIKAIAKSYKLKIDFLRARCWDQPSRSHSANHRICPGDPQN